MRFGEPQLLGDVQHERRGRAPPPPPGPASTAPASTTDHASAAAATISAAGGRVLKVVTNVELAEIEAALGR